MLKVLIAEDDLLIADMTEELLSDNGYAVCGIGRTVADAVALAWRHKPDLAILDVRLADGDLGTQIAVELAGLHHLGILYVTGNVASVTSKSVRGHACLAKPYHPRDLLRGLKIVFGMMDAGTAIQPFPANFHLLPTSGVHDDPGFGNHTARLRTLRWQQLALADFSSHVLRQGDLASVLTEAVRTCAEGLRTAFCKVHRYRAVQDDLLREAAYGWHSDVAVDLVLPADRHSPEGRAFVTRAPVVCNGLHDPAGSNRPGSVTARRGVSTMDVIIKRDDGRPYGVLGASNNAGQHYDQVDVDFVSRIADLVAVSIAGFERSAILNRTIEGLLAEAETRNLVPHLRQAR